MAGAAGLACPELACLGKASRGEIFQARKAGVLNDEKVHELGNVIAGKAPARTSDGQITVADLTGVAVQDIQIAKAVLEALLP